MTLYVIKRLTELLNFIRRRGGYGTLQIDVEDGVIRRIRCEWREVVPPQGG